MNEELYYVTVVYEIVNQDEWGKTNPLRYEHNGLKAIGVSCGDPIGNTHKVHKVCVDDAKDSMRAMPHEKRHTVNGIDVIHLMDHVI